VSGDYRFKTGYCRSNPRKMVKMWAEKELRNLARLKAAGLNVPAPVQLRMHVLVMEFIGACSHVVDNSACHIASSCLKRHF
jgi:RIO kinase 1